MTSLARRYRRGRTIFKKNHAYRKTSKGNFVPDGVVEKKVLKAIVYDRRLRDRKKMNQMTGAAIMAMALIGLLINLWTGWAEWICYLISFVMVMVVMVVMWRRIDGWLTRGAKRIVASDRAVRLK